jgi:hypothetical protein
VGYRLVAPLGTGRNHPLVTRECKRHGKAQGRHMASSYRVQ